MKKMNTRTRGFTLIELLVVIAIIGILSSIVLASLATARSKGRTSAVKESLTSLRSQMELDATSSNYGTGTSGIGTTPTNAACGQFDFLNATEANIIGNISTNSNGLYMCSVDASPATKWAMVVQLPDQSNDYCVDNSGNVKTYSYVAISGAQAQNGACQ